VKPVEHRLFVQSLREWIYTDESGRNAERVAEFVIAKAMSGHFAYFKLVIDLVDGTMRPTAEDELDFESDCVLVSTYEALDLARSPDSVKAA
jgi:hypothetical protein